METRPSGFLANRSICKGQDAVGHARRSGLVARREIERTIIHIVVFSVLSTVQQQFLNEQIVSEQSAMSTQSGCVLVNLAPYSFSSAPLNLGASRIRGCGGWAFGVPDPDPDPDLTLTTDVKLVRPSPPPPPPPPPSPPPPPRPPAACRLPPRAACLPRRSSAGAGLERWRAPLELTEMRDHPLERFSDPLGGRVYPRREAPPKP